MTRAVRIQPLIRISPDSGTRVADQDLLAVEAPLMVDVVAPDDTRLALGVLMRTPGHDHDLVVGALVGEGVVSAAAHILRVDLTDDHAEVYVSADASVSAIADRVATATSACGLCGRLDLLVIDDSPGLRATTTEPLLDAAVITKLPDHVRQAQPAFGATGGLHAAALIDRHGTVVAVREDVGRHNAVDKLIGARLLTAGLPVPAHALFVSGRVAYEIVQKAARAGLPMIIAIGAPTDLAVEAARTAGITLVGFVRDGRFNVYTHIDRVIFPSA